MNFRFFTGIALVLVAFLLQFSLAAAGVFMNLFLGALIAFAFVFTFWELVALVLLAMLIVNWQPAVSPELVVFALCPFVVFFGRNHVHLQVLLKCILATCLGFLVLYAVLAGRTFISHPENFLIDLLGGLIFGSISLLLLQRES